MISSDFSVLSNINVRYSDVKNAARFSIDFWAVKSPGEINIRNSRIRFDILLSKEYWSYKLVSKTVFKKDYV